MRKQRLSNFNSWIPTENLENIVWICVLFDFVIERKRFRKKERERECKRYIYIRMLDR